MEQANLVRLKPDNATYEFIKYSANFKPRTLRQKIAMNNLSNPDIELHIVSGGSGSGKSVMSYFAAFNHILGNEKDRKSGKVKDRIVLFKSNDIIGGKDREQGFLPGSKEEKDWPFMKSYQDAHNLCGLGNIPFENMLEGFKGEANRVGEGLYLPKRCPPIEIENLNYARGRTFENCVIIVDEAQNYTPFEMKQLIERVGVGSVIYLVGDPMQVDNPRLDTDYNGFVYAANLYFKNSHPRMSMIEFDKNFRSQSAEIMRAHKAPRD